MGEQGPKPGQGRKATAVPALLVKEHEVPLAEGDTIIGRGPDATISILGSLVSRRHAKLTSRDGRVTVEDVGSRNGVFVNGTRIASPVMLEEGDSLLIGTTQLTFFLGTPDGTPPPKRSVFDDQGNAAPEGEVLEDSSTRTAIRFESVDTVEFDREDVTIQGSRPPTPRASSAFHVKPIQTQPPPTSRRDGPPAESGALPRIQTLGRITPKPAIPGARTSAPPLVGPAVRPGSGSMTPPPAATTASPAPPSVRAPPREGGAQTSEQDPFSGALSVIDRMLARGDADAAARALSGQLARRLEQARAGAPLAADLTDTAAFRCLSLLELTGDPTWFDLLTELYTLAEVPMPNAVIDRVTPFVGLVPSASQQRLTGYQQLIREKLGEVDVEALDACERILSLGI
ncbi:MAG: FHA domain-containing protein [Polyangiaceae bacterium]|nr:FHA domain-containing protein [Polyangiaceae bacterium]